MEADTADERLFKNVIMNETLWHNKQLEGLKHFTLFMILYLWLSSVYFGTKKWKMHFSACCNKAGVILPRLPQMRVRNSGEMSQVAGG